MKNKCIVNYEKGRIRVFNGADIDEFFMFNPEEQNWQDVVSEHGFNPESLDLRFIDAAKKTEDKPEQEEKQSLLDVFKGCACIVREPKAEQVLYTYLDSIREFLGEEGSADVEPDVLEDYALCEENYSQGITFLITCSNPDKIEECKLRCEAFYKDLELLYDNPPKISMTVNY